MSPNVTRTSRRRNVLTVVFAVAVGATAAMQGIPFPIGIGPLPDFRGFQGMNDPRYPEVVKQGLVARRIADQVHVIAVTNNVVVQTGEDGVLLADNSFSMFYDQIMGAVRKISDKPIRIVTNSHSHGDHLQNNASLAKIGALVFAHTNTRNALMRQGQPQARAGITRLPGPQASQQRRPRRRSCGRWPGARSWSSTRAAGWVAEHYVGCVDDVPLQR